MASELTGLKSLENRQDIQRRISESLEHVNRRLNGARKGVFEEQEKIIAFLRQSKKDISIEAAKETITKNDFTRLEQQFKAIEASLKLLDFSEAKSPHDRESKLHSIHEAEKLFFSIQQSYNEIRLKSVV